MNTGKDPVRSAHMDYFHADRNQKACATSLPPKTTIFSGAYLVAVRTKARSQRFPAGALPHPKAAVKMLLVGATSEFYPQSWNAGRYAKQRKPEPCRRKSACTRAYETSKFRISLDQKDYPDSGRIRFIVRQDAGLHHQQLLASGRHHLRALQKPLAGGTLLQVDQALRIKQFYGTSENAVKTQIWIAVSSTSSSPSSRSASTWTPRSTRLTLFEKMPIHQALAGDENRCNASQITNQLNLFDF